ncbi:HTH-type transcriptional regulator RutR [Flagellimonas maritima]|uniref:HTH-type transcriptional regulator RutR n=1 Tax=Flagellimonas maritima TaxID=1383885 RepID=A0A2Z4LSS3_9FLAO|nr:TetR/AcrR family transcriptional regulator [Allomuricauda aurantiaca]AWX44398.1 HTH-type transcriptional regulator RutR [Allomuricauda aurantiaca]
MDKPIKKDTEAEILKAAKRVFIEKGYDGARMQEIADEANINKAMLHYYFRSKEALFSKILEEAVDLSVANMFPAFQYNGTIMEKMERLVNNYIDTMSKNPHIPLFLLSEMSRGQQSFQTKLKSKMMENGILPAFIHQYLQEQEQRILRPVPPNHFILTVMSLINFPFIAKSIFITMLDLPEKDFLAMMQERKTIVINVLKDSFTQS